MVKHIGAANIGFYVHHYNNLITGNEIIHIIIFLPLVISGVYRTQHESGAPLITLCANTTDKKRTVYYCKYGSSLYIVTGIARL